MKATTSFYFVIQPCQVHQMFGFYQSCCNLKEKGHIRRKINSKKKNYMWNQYYY